MLDVGVPLKDPATLAIRPLDHFKALLAYIAPHELEMFFYVVIIEKPSKLKLNVEPSQNPDKPLIL